MCKFCSVSIYSTIQYARLTSVAKADVTLQSSYRAEDELRSILTSVNKQ